MDGLIDGGVRDVVICPGSRSTPLALAFAMRAGNVRQWILYDERSAAFFALGIAKTSSAPVAILCTSGTAAANLLPAVAEAKLARVPIVAVTADRPPEARDFGGAQTIDQLRLFTTHVKWFHEMPVASATSPLARYSRRVGARASNTSSSHPQGPVQVNFPFREPLVSGSSLSALPEVGEGDSGTITIVGGPPACADEADIQRVAERLRAFSKGIIVVGPGEFSASLRSELSSLSESLGWPILADVLSNLRQDGALRSGLVRAYETMVRGDKFKSNKPDCVIRLGGVPTSKELNAFCHGALTILLDDGREWRDPDFRASTMIFGDLEHSVSCMNRALQGRPAVNDHDGRGGDTGPQAWLKLWLEADAESSAGIKSLMEGREGEAEETFEGKLFYLLSSELKPPSPLSVVVGSSMPVRDLDYFFLHGDKNIRFIANRGANGIDGVVSTAMGVSAVEGDVLLILGDISFYHDMNGLLASKLYQLNATIIVINNRGGGIFSFLAQHSLPTDLFERLFGEAHDLDFSGVRLIYGGEFTRVFDWSGFKSALARSINGKGLKVIELIVPDRERNLELHKKAFEILSRAGPEPGERN